MSGAASELGLSGRFIREVVAYENQTTGGFFRVEVRTHLLSKLRYVQFHVVTKVLQCIFSVGYADRDHKRSENSSSRRFKIRGFKETIEKH